MNYMCKKIILLLILSWTFIYCIYAQDSTANNSVKIRYNILLISSLTGSTLILGTVPCLPYFESTESVRFHFYNDNSGYLLVDKLIHSYYSYITSNIWYQGLTKAGVNKDQALVLGGTIGFILLTPKEVFDGFTKDGGFSWGDMLANAAGPALFVGQELLFDEQIFKYKFSFSRSEYADQSNGYLGKTMTPSYFRDYNGHTYWLSINASKIFPETKVPGWINIAVGYSANGMFGKYENKDSYKGVEIPETQRYRQFLLSLDVDWSKIKVNSKFLRLMLNGMNFIKVPFPAFDINSKGHLKGYWIYF